MTGDDKQSHTAKADKAAARNQRQERLAKALRDNLRRRHQQRQDRARASEDEPKTG